MAYDPNLSIAEAIRRYGLPRSHRVHWSDELKADVVHAVHSRIISFHEARERYLLSRDEFEQWERAFGGQALRAQSKPMSASVPTPVRRETSEPAEAIS
jgi:transposase-like protein